LATICFKVRLAQRLQHVDHGTRQQGRIHLERGVFRGGAYEGEEAAFHMRQKGVLLAFVEAVHLVDKDDGAPPALRLPDAGLLHGLADVLDAAQHGRDGDEVRVKTAGHEPRDGGLAHAGRAPEDAAVRLAGFKGDAQRHAFAQQVLLAYHFAQGFAGAGVRPGAGGRRVACHHGRAWAPVYRTKSGCGCRSLSHRAGRRQGFW
jgi:hypothetical protein